MTSDETSDDGTSSANASDRAADATNPDGVPAILQAVASGEMDATEAARRIDALRAEAPDPNRTDATDQDAWAVSTDRPQYATHTRESAPPDAPAGSPSAGPGNSSTNLRRAAGVDRLALRAVGRRVQIVGDAKVRSVAADGPHTMRQTGSVIEVSSDGELGAPGGRFQLLRGAPRSLDDFRSLGLGKELVLRVNPGLLVDCEVIAGSLQTEALPRLGDVRLTAGNAKLLNVAEIADGLIQAGHTTVRGAINTSRSRIRIESGSLNLELGTSSDVTIHTESQLGRITWGGEHAGTAADEVGIGAGTARLDVEVAMGHASIKSGADGSDATAAPQD